MQEILEFIKQLSKEEEDVVREYLIAKSDVFITDNYHRKVGLNDCFLRNNGQIQILGPILIDAVRLLNFDEQITLKLVDTGLEETDETKEELIDQKFKFIKFKKTKINECILIDQNIDLKF